MRRFKQSSTDLEKRVFLGQNPYNSIEIDDLTYPRQKQSEWRKSSSLKGNDQTYFYQTSSQSLVLWKQN